MRGKESIMENAEGEHVATGSFRVDMEAMKRKTDEINVKISNVTVEAFFREFPFLQEYVRKDKIDDTSLSNISAEVFKKRERYSGCGCIFSSEHHPIRILDDKGKILTYIGAIIGPKKSFWKSAQRSESIEAAINYLEKIGEAQKAKFILCITHSTLVLCMPPKGFTILEWLNEQINVASAKLKKEMEQINSKSEELKKD